MGKRKAAPITVRTADGKVRTVKAGYFQKQKQQKRKQPKPTRAQMAHWQATRQEALARDDHRCVDCGRRRGDDDPRLKPGRKAILEIHHLTYERRWKELLEDVVTLCQRCHATRHQWKRRGVML